MEAFHEEIYNTLFFSYDFLECSKEPYISEIVGHISRK